MSKVATVIPLLLLCWLLAIPALAGNNSPKEKQAALVALGFLEQVDRAEYEQSWESSSRYFQEKIELSQWVQEITHLRPRFGQNQQRQLQMTKPLEGSAATDNQPMMLLIFRSTFAKKTAIEMVTMVKDPDGLWRVGGYTLQ